MEQLLVISCQLSVKKRQNKFFSFAFLLVVCCLLLVTFSVFAEDITFSTSVSSAKVSLGSSLKLNLDFTGVSNISDPKLPKIEGFNWRYIGPATSVLFTNGRTSSSVTHAYQLLPLKEGTFTIPSFSVTYKGKAYSSKPIVIEVTKGAVLSGRNLAQDSTTLSEDLKDSIFLRLEAGKKIAYVNEIIPISVKLYMRELSVSDVGYPRLSQEEFLVTPFAQYKKYRETVDGLDYNVIEFSTTAFALGSGELVMGPVELQCSLLLRREARRSPFNSFFGGFDDFFNRYERYPLNVVSDKLVLVVKNLPVQDKPKGFNQSLGEYTFHLQAETKKVNVGDPITLRMIVSGKGNFKTVNAPAIDFSDDFKIYEPQVERIKDSKMFEQVIIPRSEDISQIPSISFSFFNPQKESYETITKPPIAIKVIKPDSNDRAMVEDYSSVLGPNEEEVLKRDIIFIKDKIGKLRKKDAFLCNNFIFIVLQIIPLVILGIIFTVTKKARRIKTDARYARRLFAPAKAKKGIRESFLLLESKETEKFFDSVHKTMSHYFSGKLHLPIGGVTIEAINKALSPRKISKNTLDKVKEVFTKCEMARYAPFEFTHKDMEAIFKNMQEVIDRVERKKV